MASQYYVQREAQESGPYVFRDLVSLVREGQLVDSDLVRYSWTQDWQRADSLVGLFRMAKRAPEAPPLESPIVTADVVVADQLDAMLPDVDDRPGWMLRLLQVGRFRRKKLAETQILGPIATSSADDTVASGTSLDSDSPSHPIVETSHPPATSTTRPGVIASRLSQLAPELAEFAQRESSAPGDNWSSIVNDALASVEFRRAGKRKSRGMGRLAAMFQRRGRSIPRGEAGGSISGIGFRLVCAIICANLVAWAVDSWSAQEALRFPSRDAPASALRHFPLFGTCGERVYLFLVFDLMLLTAAAAWLTAGWIESHTD